MRSFLKFLKYLNCQKIFNIKSRCRKPLLRERQVEDLNLFFQSIPGLLSAKGDKRRLW